MNQSALMTEICRRPGLNIAGSRGRIILVSIMAQQHQGK
jgi:hypothetical protein